MVKENSKLVYKSKQCLCKIIMSFYILQKDSTIAYKSERDDHN